MSICGKPALEYLHCDFQCKSLIGRVKKALICCWQGGSRGTGYIDTHKEKRLPEVSTLCVIIITYHRCCR